MSNTTHHAYPDHYMDPKKKGKDFVMKYAKAAWHNYSLDMPDGSIFYAKRDKYAEIRAYAMNLQSVNKYKKELVLDEQADDSWLKINWEPRADGSNVRNIIVANLQKAGFNVIATPVNQHAADAQDEEFAKVRVKIMMRDALLKTNPELAQMAELKRMPGEAEDLEELQLQVDHSPKFIRSKDIEESVELVMYENEADTEFDKMAEDVVDFGVGIMKEWLDENNKVRLRTVNPADFICSFTDKKDFSDVVHAGELISVKLSDLAKKFSKEEVQDIIECMAGKHGNPSYYQSWETAVDLFKVKVLDIEFLSWDKEVYEVNKNAFGNIKMSKTKPNKQGQSGDRQYLGKTVQAIYKGKWILGTDLVYDYGKAKNQKRTVEVATMSRTKLSYHIHAANFDKMKAVGMTEKLIPIIDDLNMAVYKLRNFRNNLIPNGFDIDVSALENVAIGAGGAKMKPIELIEMFVQKGILLSRRSGTSMDKNVNYKAINPIVNSMAEQLVSLANDIQLSKQALRETTGLNDLTDGSTPNAKTLTTVANMAKESTNNALFYLINCRSKVIEKLSKGIVQRLQVAVKYGPYDGYNKKSGRWISVPKSIAHYDYDIMIENQPSDEQKQWLYNMVQKDIENQILDTGDVFHIVNTNNLKSAQILLSWKAKRNRERKQNEALQNTQATAKAQMESAEYAEKVRRETEVKIHDMKLEQINLEKAWDYLIKKETSGTNVQQKAEGMIAGGKQEPVPEGSEMLP